MSLRIAELTEAETAETVEGAGLGALTTDRGNLPLRGLDIRAGVVGLTARTTVTQKFHNPHDEPIEAVYIFPLPARAAVTGMTMTVAERTVVAELQERAAARKAYRKAVKEGKRAAIAEAERADVFTMRVGNILPGEEAVVELTLVGPLEYEDGEATLRLPLVVAPRYIPGEPLDGSSSGVGHAPDTDAVPDASRITPPVLLPGFPNPVELSIEADVDPGGLELSHMASSLHVVETSEDPEGRVRARIHPGERVNRDFILRFSYGSQDAVGHALTTVPDADGLPSGYFQLTALPPREASAAARPRDVVVVLDRSGSMSGWKMTAARRAASRIVDTLSSRDRFAVRCFDNQITVPDGLDDGLVPASDRNRYRAVEHLGRTNARGGTEMLGPLNEAVDLLRAAEPGHDRIVVLVTDGQVGNEDQILARLDGRLDGIRIHVIGIDRAVNAGFLHRLALAGRGRCELVESEDRLDAAAAHIHRRIVAPVVTSLSLTGEGVDVVDGTLAPARLPDLFTGVPLVLWGRYDNAVDDAELVLTGVDADGEPWRRAVSSRHAADDGVKEMWGRARLRDLEDRYAAAPRSGKLTPERPDAPATLTELEQLIVETSLGCGVLSRFTAFTAVDTRVVVDEGGEPRTVVQPVELPEGWEMPLAPGAGAPAPTHLSAAPMMIAAPMANPEAAGPSGPVAPLGFKTASGDAGSAPSDPVARTRRTAPGKSRRGRSKLLDLDQIRKILAAELRILDPEFRTLEWKPPEVIARERRAMLSDLATRLGVVADALEQLPDAPADAAATLRALLPELERCEGPRSPAGKDLETLWERTLDLLRDLSRGAASDPAAAAQPPKPDAEEGDDFWKRRP